LAGVSCSNCGGRISGGGCGEKGKIVFERRPVVAALMLNRPQFDNTLTWGKCENAQNCAAVESDPEIRLMIVRGARDTGNAAFQDGGKVNDY
jgi:enoyl-CoA hydratase/carnithine racemase